MVAIMLNELKRRRAGLAELAFWALLAAAFIIVMARGETNGFGHFDQRRGAALWAPLICGGLVNFWIVYAHAFKAMPLLQRSGGRLSYLAALAGLLVIYLLAHLICQLAIVAAFEPELASVSAIDWTLENLVAAPLVIGFSAMYKFARDWLAHGRERAGFAAQAAALNAELSEMRTELRSAFGVQGESAFLRFECNREQIQTPVSAISFLKAAGNYVEIVAGDRTYTVYGAIKDLLARLPETKFARVHRSFVVNLDRVETISGRTITIGETVIPIGASFRSAFLAQWRGTTVQE